jgi:hypothetical protein
LGFGVQLDGKGLLQVELGCENNYSMLKYMHCGKTLIGNIENVLDFDIYRNVGRYECCRSNEL